MLYLCNNCYSSLDWWTVFYLRTSVFHLRTPSCLGAGLFCNIRYIISLWVHPITKVILHKECDSCADLALLCAFCWLLAWLAAWASSSPCPASRLLPVGTNPGGVGGGSRWGRRVAAQKIAPVLRASPTLFPVDSRKYLFSLKNLPNNHLCK